jgi:hypothetical protein
MESTHGWRLFITCSTKIMKFDSETHKDAKYDTDSNQAPDSTKYSASRGLPMCAVISGGILTTKGLCVDTVSETLLVSGKDKFLRDLQGTVPHYLESPCPTGGPTWLAVQLT